MWAFQNRCGGARETINFFIWPNTGAYLNTFCIGNKKKFSWQNNIGSLRVNTLLKTPVLYKTHQNLIR